MVVKECSASVVEPEMTHDSRYSSPLFIQPESPIPVETWNYPIFIRSIVNIFQEFATIANGGKN